MESFIAELEAERIAELEAYLLATGLKDYTLTAKEQLDLVIKSDNQPLNTLVIRRLKIDRADPAVS
jgi:hypothetical protein